MVDEPTRWGGREGGGGPGRTVSADPRGGQAASAGRGDRADDHRAAPGDAGCKGAFGPELRAGVERLGGFPGAPVGAVPADCLGPACPTMYWLLPNLPAAVAAMGPASVAGLITSLGHVVPSSLDKRARAACPLRPASPRCEPGSGAEPTASKPSGTARSWFTLAPSKAWALSVCQELPLSDVSTATELARAAQALAGFGELDAHDQSAVVGDEAGRHGLVQRAAEDPFGARLVPAAVLVYQDIGLAGDVVGEDRCMAVGGDEAEMPPGVVSSSFRQGHLAPCKAVGRLPEALAARAAADRVQGPVGPGCRVRDGAQGSQEALIEWEALRGLAPGKAVRGDPRGWLPAGPDPDTADRQQARRARGA